MWADRGLEKVMHGDADLGGLIRGCILHLRHGESIGLDRSRQSRRFTVWVRDHERDATSLHCDGASLADAFVELSRCLVERSRPEGGR